MAARVFGVGKSRVKISLNEPEKLEDAITRGSMRSLKKSGLVDISQKQGISRGRIRIQHKKTKRGRICFPFLLIM